MKSYSILFLLLFTFISTLYSQHMNAGLQVGLAQPTGNFSNSVTTGFGAQGNFNLIFNDHLHFAASLGYYTWTGNDETLEKYYDYKFYTIPITLGLKYIINNTDIRPFALAELGLHVTNSSYLIPEKISNYYTAYNKKAEMDDISIGASLGGGVIIPMDRIVSFETAVKFTSIASKDEAKYFISIITGITVLIKS